MWELLYPSPKNILSIGHVVPRRFHEKLREKGFRRVQLVLSKNPKIVTPSATSIYYVGGGGPHGDW